MSYYDILTKNMKFWAFPGLVPEPAERDTGDELVASDPVSELHAANAINAQTYTASETERKNFLVEICITSLILL